MTASFHSGQPGVRHQDPMPTVVSPDSLPEVDSRNYGLDWERWDIRAVPLPAAAGEARNRVWLRYRDPLPNVPFIHQCAFAYASDMTLLGAASSPYPGVPVRTAALDHAMWFQRPFRADEWLLFDEWSPSADGGRAFTEGNVFDIRGNLVAIIAQERSMTFAGPAVTALMTNDRKAG